jgi:hypothetical protein
MNKQTPKLQWFPAPVHTSWGASMVVATFGLTKDNTLDLYCEREMTPLVDKLFAEIDRRNGDALGVSACEACSGRGEVGGFQGGGAPGYVSEDCPACGGTGMAGTATSDEPSNKDRADFAAWAAEQECPRCTGGVRTTLDAVRRVLEASGHDGTHGDAGCEALKLIAAVGAEEMKRLDAESAALKRSCDELVQALKEMLFHHGNPRRDEWMNEVAWQEAVNCNERARAAISAATGQPS